MTIRKQLVKLLANRTQQARCKARQDLRKVLECCSAITHAAEMTQCLLTSTEETIADTTRRLGRVDSLNYILAVAESNAARELHSRLLDGALRELRLIQSAKQNAIRDYANHIMRLNNAFKAGVESRNEEAARLTEQAKEERDELEQKLQPIKIEDSMATWTLFWLFPSLCMCCIIGNLANDDGPLKNSQACGLLCALLLLYPIGCGAIAGWWSYRSDRATFWADQFLEDKVASIEKSRAVAVSDMKSRWQSEIKPIEDSFREAKNDDEQIAHAISMLELLA